MLLTFCEGLLEAQLKDIACLHSRGDGEHVVSGKGLVCIFVEGKGGPSQ